MNELKLPREGGSRTRGRAHGEHFRPQIGEIASLRLELVMSFKGFESLEMLREVCRAHLPVLRAFDEALFDELLGIGEGAAVAPEDIVALNHYTDLKDIHASAHRDEDCSAIVTVTPEGPLLAQTWDMHGSAEPYVVLLEIPELDDAPAVFALSLTGCLGLAGMNAHGVGVTINNLRSHDAQVGVVWPALVRRMLREDTIHAARHVLMTAPMSSGHHYLMASEEGAIAVETSGQKKDEIFRAEFASDRDALFIHTNHCLSESIAQVSSVAEGSTSHERYAWLDANVRKTPIAGRDDLFRRLGSHDGYPRSLCTHLSSPETPHATKTCGGIVMDLSRREILTRVGCLHEAKPELRTFS